MMRLNASARMHVVHSEEKEVRLKEFIQQDLAARKAAGQAALAAPYRLVARSWESPAARALAFFAEDARSQGIEIRAVFADHVAVAGASVIATAECRTISDPRLLNAHELLILSATSAWVGDSLRRDPTRRDSYECFAGGCQTTIRWCTLSFDRIWTATAPTSGEEKLTARALKDGMLEASLIAASEMTPAMLAMRH